MKKNILKSTYLLFAIVFLNDTLSYAQQTLQTVIKDQPASKKTFNCNTYANKFGENDSSVAVQLNAMATVFYLEMKEQNSKKNLEILKKAFKEHLPLCVVTLGNKITEVSFAIIKGK